MEQLYKIEQVEALIGRKRSAIYNDIRAGTFPAPLHVGKKSSRWPASTLQQWLDSLQVVGSKAPTGDRQP